MSNALFWPEDVRLIVGAERLHGENALEDKWVPSLKDRVTAQVREVTGITGKLPDRLRTWIHQLCMLITADIRPVFYDDEKAKSPIDLNSLPKSQRPEKTS